MATVVDLFAGAGGFTIAARLAGGEPVLSVELDSTACDTLRKNSSGGHTVLEADITTCSGAELRSIAEIDDKRPLIVAGGPPCQPFSKAAYWLEDGADAEWRRDRAKGVHRERPPAPTEARPDDRRSLVEHYLRVVCEIDADGFVFENVPSILHPRNRPIVDGLVAAAHANGYQTTVVKALASDFGVPQHRERVFVLGSRSGTPVPPAVTHDGRGKGLIDTLPAVTAGQALSRLPSGERDEPEVEVTGTWADHLREIPPGMNYKFHTAWAGHPNPTFEAETRFWNFLLVLDPDKPSWTIPANPGPWVGPFHWDHRRLFTEELAALQGFPPGYTFAGNRRERVRQLGNAVPPPMAASMIAAVMDSLGVRRRSCAA